MSRAKKAAKRILLKWDCDGWVLIDGTRMCLMHNWLWQDDLPFCNAVGRTKRDAIELAYFILKYKTTNVRRKK